METINVKQEMDDLIRKFENKEIDIEALTIGCFHLGKRVQALLTDIGKTMPPIDWANFSEENTGLSDAVALMNQKIEDAIKSSGGGNS